MSFDVEIANNKLWVHIYRTTYVFTTSEAIELASNLLDAVATQYKKDLEECAPLDVKSSKADEILRHFKERIYCAETCAKCANNIGLLLSCPRGIISKFSDISVCFAFMPKAADDQS